MVTVPSGLAAGSAVLLATLAALGTTVGLGAAAWVTGVGCGLVTSGAVTRGGAGTLGPADLVTLTRAVLACAAAALVADSFAGRAVVPTLVSLTVAALALDAVDGWIARRTGTASAFGARFDGEVDAFLILVLSVYVAAAVAGWVLAIGAARYAFGVAGWCWPWLGRRLPPRYWRKVVAATQGIVLTVAAASVLPHAMTYAALLAALALLTESFGRDVLWCWRHRAAPSARPSARPAGRPAELDGPPPRLGAQRP